MGIRELSADEATVIIPDEDINWSEGLTDFPSIIGQPRALQALKMGTEIHKKGYNIFVTGLSGTGRISAIKKILSGYKPDHGALKDIVYVYNFKFPDNPRVLYLPKAEGIRFKESIHSLVENIKETVKKRLDSEAFKNRRDALVSAAEQEENRRITDFEAKLGKEGFQIVQISDEESETTDLQPVWKGEGISFDKLQDLVKEGAAEENYWNITREKYYRLMDEMQHVFQEIGLARNDLEKKLDDLKAVTVKPSVESSVSGLKAKYNDEKIAQYLSDMKEDIIRNLFLFLKEQPADESGTPALIRYGVNVIVDHSLTENVPVIFENHPRYSNLFGSIDSKLDMNGESRTNFMMITAGSLIRASGGVIVLKAEDVLREEGVWENLKSALQTGRVEIQPSGGAFSFQISSLKPGAVKISTKIIMVGNENLYDALFNTDREFQKHFKVSAEFDSEMDRTRENTGQYVSFIKMITSEENLRETDPDGIKEIIKYGISMSEQKDKLSTRFSMIADLIREADYWAAEAGIDRITAESVTTAIKKRKFLYDLPEEKINSMISKGEILIDVDSTAVGKVNGLAIHDRGYYSFGTPAVITAQAVPGSEGIINIERESGLSGEIHDKGLMILEGCIRDRYARNFPLSVYASICFEQSYSEVDGDSASSTEIYAILSAVTGVPLKQYIAVTGSVSQMGEIQPVGGISEKVSGFFTICRQIGLNGKQGVIIPEQNINNLILPEEICAEIDKGNFHVYPVSDISQGIEILTGMEAGERNKKGIYPAGTFNNLVETRLKEMAQLVKSYNN